MEDGASGSYRSPGRMRRPSQDSGNHNWALLGILDRKRHWIRAALDRADENRKFFHPTPSWQAPQRIALPAIGRQWNFQACPSSVPWAAVRETSAGLLQLHGNVTSDAACRPALHRWLSRMAHQYLVPILQEISRTTGRPFVRVYVKRQRTRWASCSRHKSVSLNAKLLFLSPDLVRYVMIHELCHTQVMCHSKQFWLHVQAACPDYRTLDTRLRQAWKNVPEWSQSSNGVTL